VATVSGGRNEALGCAYSEIWSDQLPLEFGLPSHSADSPRFNIALANLVQGFDVKTDHPG
jgi:hypothetical protein